MSYDTLNKINSISDLKALPDKEIEPLCSDIREFLVEKVEQNGGHLASNLGVAELTVALHRIFDSPCDHIIFDVGHQGYVHKMLTGRKDQFDGLRKTGGLSGFTVRAESEHDAFGAGHSSTAISAALGFAESDRLAGNDAYSIAVVGDGAFTGGMVHEAINNCKEDLKLIIILNDNGMSISNNKGAFASYMSSFRASKKYINAKEGTRSVLRHIPLIGPAIKWCISKIKDAVKWLVYKPNYFEQLGFYYIGPVDGNDYKKTERALRKAKSLQKCVIIHLKTTKGKGFEKAENEPDKFHSVSGMKHRDDSFHSVFASSLISLARDKKDIVAVTAAMGLGTGLCAFESEFHDRYFDVGIAEPHALTFAAGMAANGLIPYTAIYSTFLQRGYDNIIHDIALQNLPVKIFIDRAGLAPADGPTHHGIFDVSFLSHIPNMYIYSPADYDALKRCIELSYSINAPVAVRYPNASESDVIVKHFENSELYTDANIRTDFDIDDAPKNIFVTYGVIAENVIKAKEILNEGGIECGIILIERLKPYDAVSRFIADAVSDNTHIVFAEEGIKNGGAGMIIKSALADKLGNSSSVRFDIAAIDDDFASPLAKCELYDYVGLSPLKLAEYFK